MTESDPAPLAAGMIGIELDPLGRLLRFEAVPAAPATQPSGHPPDWDALFAAAGLEPSAFTADSPAFLPPFYADSRMAWTEATPGIVGRPLRVEAAALGGRPVYFELAGPWTLAPHASGTDSAANPAELAFPIAFIVLLVGGGLLARRNLRLGRSDRQGAMRLALFNLAAFMIDWAFESRHVAGFDEVSLFIQGLGRALFVASLSWLIYVALEPLIRRRWPDSLIAWTRLLSGHFTDPLVGRTLLAGALLGVFQAVASEVSELAERALAPAPPIPTFQWDLTLLGPRAVAGHLAAAWAVDHAPRHRARPDSSSC